jgi:hypothetical protein
VRGAAADPLLERLQRRVERARRDLASGRDYDDDDDPNAPTPERLNA